MNNSVDSYKPGVFDKSGGANWYSFDPDDLMINYNNYMFGGAGYYTCPTAKQTDQILNHANWCIFSKTSDAVRYCIAELSCKAVVCQDDKGYCTATNISVTDTLTNYFKVSGVNVTPTPWLKEDVSESSATITFVIPQSVEIQSSNQGSSNVLKIVAIAMAVFTLICSACFVCFVYSLKQKNWDSNSEVESVQTKSTGPGPMKRSNSFLSSISGTSSFSLKDFKFIPLNIVPNRALGRIRQ